MHLVSFGASDREINMGTREARVARCSWDEREREEDEERRRQHLAKAARETAKEREGEREENWREWRQSGWKQATAGEHQQSTSAGESERKGGSERTGKRGRQMEAKNSISSFAQITFLKNTATDSASLSFVPASSLSLPSLRRSLPLSSYSSHALRLT